MLVTVQAGGLVLGGFQGKTSAACLGKIDMKEVLITWIY